jgi:hypothetical protein
LGESFMSIPKIEAITGRHMDAIHIEAMRIIVKRGNPARDAAMATVHPDMRRDVYAYVTGYATGAADLVEGYEQIKAEGIATDPAFLAGLACGQSDGMVPA